VRLKSCRSCRAKHPHVFIGGKTGQPLSNMAMLELMKAMRSPRPVSYSARGYIWLAHEYRDDTTAPNSYPTA
jgi:hypothetical protein